MEVGTIGGGSHLILIIMVFFLSNVLRGNRPHFECLAYLHEMHIPFS